MAQRPAFLASRSGPLVVTETMEFPWYAGIARSRKQMCMRSLHQAIIVNHPAARILEVSRMSDSALGVSLSAFNLTFATPKSKRIISVESAFQASKVFESGGPFTDLLDRPSSEAKRDPRLQTSGRLVGFRFFGEDWPIEPQTLFYDWLYLNALLRNRDLTKSLTAYDVFTDIMFNPKKSINCQARSVALYVSLSLRGSLDQAMSSRKDFMAATHRETSSANSSGQPNLL